MLLQRHTGHWLETDFHNTVANFLSGGTDKDLDNAFFRKEYLGLCYPDMSLKILRYFPPGTDEDALLIYATGDLPFFEPIEFPEMLDRFTISQQLG